MKKIIILGLVLVNLGLSLTRADEQPTAFEKALYDRARNEVLSHLNDDDFVSYCTTMNFGGETLLKLHDDVLLKQTQLDLLLKQGLTSENPQVAALDESLANLRIQLSVKVLEARKGLQVEAKVAEATLSALAQYQK